MSTSLLLCALGGYFIGSVPFGLVLCYLFGYGDIRKIGSGNIGATNVLRTGNKFLALLTLLLDAFKAGLAAYIAAKILPTTQTDFLGFAIPLNQLGSLIAGTFTVLGHNFPVWLKFKGGKGVASSFGLILFTQWQIALIGLLVWLAMAFTFRYSSLSALTAAVAVVLATWLLCPPVYALFYTSIAVLLIVRHHANISRLLSGKESKITFKKSTK